MKSSKHGRTPTYVMIAITIEFGETYEAFGSSLYGVPLQQQSVAKDPC